jgi:pimeloyl-ACP methyl ester carboxylesterase
MASLVVKVTRAVLRLVAAQSPQAAGELAFWLFTRTRSTKPQSDKERKALERAKQRMAESETVYLTIPGSLVATHVFRPAAGLAPGPDRGQKVLVVHGYRSRSDHMVTMADALAAAGHTAVCLDLPGHGASSGRTLHLGKAVEAIDAAWRQHGPFDAFVGHSFGGPSVMAAAAGSILHVPQRRPDRIVTIAAPSNLAEVFHWAGKVMGLGAAAQSAFERQVLRFSGRPLSEFRVDRMMHGNRIRTLVIHAEDDKEVAYSNAEAIARTGSHVRLLKANGFGHRRIVSAEPVTRAIVEFLGAEAGRPEIVGLPLSSSPEENMLAATDGRRSRRRA